MGTANMTCVLGTLLPPNIKGTDPTPYTPPPLTPPVGNVWLAWQGAASRGKGGGGAQGKLFLCSPIFHIIFHALMNVFFSKKFQ